MSRPNAAAAATVLLAFAVAFSASHGDGGARATILLTPTPSGDPNSWSYAGDLAYPRWNHVAVTTSDGRHMVFGGNAADGGPLPIEQYDGASGWKTLSGPAQLDTIATANALPDARVFVTGSVVKSGIADLRAEIFDPDSGAWSTTRRPLFNREGHTTSVLNDGRVFVAGGYVGGQFGTTRSKTAEIYDPLTDTWKQTADAPTSHAKHTATVLDDGRVLLTASLATSGHRPSSAEMYDPNTNTWGSTGPALNREGAQAVKLHDGRVLVVGGVDYPAGLPLPVPPEVFDPVGDQWSAAGGVLAIDHTATLMDDGLVLVTLGALHGGAGKEAFVYLPAQNDWAAVASMAEARRSQAADSFEGRVVVTGGALPYRALGSAERYAPGAMPSPDPPTATPTPTHTPTPGNSPTPTATGFSFQDTDGDGWLGVNDNCPFVYNPNQENTDQANDDTGLPGADPAGDACDPNDDGDGCDDYDELRGAEEFGGFRSRLSFWDWFDVTDSGRIDLSDTLDVLSFFGDPGSASTPGNLRDRESADSAQPWRTSEANDGVDLTDVLASLAAFGHECE